MVIGYCVKLLEYFYEDTSGKRALIARRASEIARDLTRESADFLAKDRPLPPVSRGDLVAVFSAGAYGMSMSSNYNGRCRAAEVLVTGKSYEVIRRRETYEDLVRNEL